MQIVQKIFQSDFETTLLSISKLNKHQHPGIQWSILKSLSCMVNWGTNLKTYKIKGPNCFFGTIKLRPFEDKDYPKSPPTRHHVLSSKLIIEATHYKQMIGRGILSCHILKKKLIFFLFFYLCYCTAILDTLKFVN